MPAEWQSRRRLWTAFGSACGSKNAVWQPQRLQLQQEWSRGVAAVGRGSPVWQPQRVRPSRRLSNTWGGRAGGWREERGDAGRGDAGAGEVTFSRRKEMVQPCLRCLHAIYLVARRGHLEQEHLVPGHPREEDPPVPRVVQRGGGLAEPDRHGLARKRSRRRSTTPLGTPLGTVLDPWVLPPVRPPEHTGRKQYSRAVHWTVLA